MMRRYFKLLFVLAVIDVVLFYPVVGYFIGLIPGDTEIGTGYLGIWMLVGYVAATPMIIAHLAVLIGIPFGGAVAKVGQWVAK